MLGYSQLQLADSELSLCFSDEDGVTGAQHVEARHVDATQKPLVSVVAGWHLATSSKPQTSM